MHGVCAFCGKPFKRKRGPKKDAAKYCSRECGFNARREYGKWLKEERARQREIASHKVCKHCGAAFVAEKITDVYCSEKCKADESRDRAKKRMAIIRPLLYKSQTVKCRHCGKIFQTQYKKSKIFCSDECRDQHAKELDRKASARRSHNHEKRIRNRLVDRDITLEKLIARDNGRCKLCGGKVDKNDFKIVNGRMRCGNKYPSIDHILPLSQGGVHSWANVQLAHFLCNSLKGGNFMVRQDIATW